MKEGPSTSVRRASLRSGLSKSTIHRIARYDLNLFPYKVQVTQPITTDDAEKRFEFANLMIDALEKKSIDKSKIWFTDEAHFYLNGHVNKENMRFWGQENPRISVVKPLHPKNYCLVRYQFRNDSWSILH